MRRGVATTDEVTTPTPPAGSATPRLGRRLGALLRQRFASADPLVGVVGLVSLGVYLMHGFDKAVTRDLGVYLYGGQRFLSGDPPYVGVLNRAGPLAHALPGVGMWLGRPFGLSDIHAARVFYMLLAVGCVCLCYLVIRDLTGSRAAALIAAAAFLTFQGFVDLATYGPREKTPMVLFLLVVLLAVRHRRWATSGAFIALATLNWQPVFFAAVTTAIVAALLAPEGRLRAVARIFVGGAGVSALVLGYYALYGAVHTLLDCFVLINAQYTKQPGALADLSGNWGSVRQGYGPAVWVILLGLAAMPIAAVTSARAAWRSHESAAATYVGLGAGWLGGVVWSVVAYNGWPDLFVLLPFSLIGVGWIASEVLRRLDLRVALVVAVVLSLLGTSYAAAYSVTTRQHDLWQQEESIAAVLGAGPQPATILSMESPQVLVMTHRTNATPYQMFDHGFPGWVDATYPGGLKGYLATIERLAPTYIAVTPRWKPAWFIPWLKEHYVPVGDVRRIRWWVSKSVSPTMREEIRAANLAAK
jgi:hypothetical protein